jgi:PilZ domain
MTVKKKARPASIEAHHSGTLRTEVKEPPAETPASPEQAADRRRHPRYRLSIPVTLRKDGALISSMTVEISQSGMSIATVANLNTGETVDVEPVGGDKASAVVRRRRGNFYGLEFVRLTEAQLEQLRNACRKLPLFRTHSLKI